MKRHLFLLAVGLLGFSGLPAFAEIRLPTLFGDQMVLQQGKPLPVWGWGEVGEPVAVRYAWADMPFGNLYNKAGLPAGPFETKVGRRLVNP